jgi:hypothetical protein
MGRTPNIFQNKKRVLNGKKRGEISKEVAELRFQMFNFFFFFC